MTREIPLSKGYVALVDDADYEWLVERGPWHASGHKNNLYAVHTEFTPPNSFKPIRMHLLILPTDLTVDHINRNPFDNRRSNLRIATHRQNSQNRKQRSDSKMPYKGIQRMKKDCKNPWIAGISIDGKRVHLGVFPTAEDAARAYDEAARKHHGEFAYVNFPITEPKGETVQ